MNLPVFSCIAIALISVSAFAADKPKFYDEVTAVDETSITLYRTPTKDAKFTVSGETKVTIDGKHVKIGDVKVGMKATVMHKPDSEEATSVNAQTVKVGKGKRY